MKTNNNQENKKKIRLYPKIILGLMILILLLEFAIPLVNDHFIKPRKFKNTIFKDLRNNPEYAYLTDDEIINYADCLYCKFKDLYEDIDDFPMKEDYRKVDVWVILSCGADHIFKDEKQKFVYEHMDSLVNAAFIPRNP